MCTDIISSSLKLQNAKNTRPSSRSLDAERLAKIRSLRSSSHTTFKTQYTHAHSFYLFLNLSSHVLWHKSLSLWHEFQNGVKTRRSPRNCNYGMRKGSANTFTALGHKQHCPTQGAAKVWADPFPRACNWFLLFVKLLGSTNYFGVHKHLWGPQTLLGSTNTFTDLLAAYQRLLFTPLRSVNRRNHDAERLVSITFCSASWIIKARRNNHCNRGFWGSVSVGHNPNWLNFCAQEKMVHALSKHV